MIRLDLKDALPRLSQAFDRGELRMQQSGFNMRICRYSENCAIYAMIPNENPDKMLIALDYDDVDLAQLLDMGVITAPDDQRDDIIRIQRVHDSGVIRSMELIISELERKYATCAQLSFKF